MSEESNRPVVHRGEFIRILQDEGYLCAGLYRFDGLAGNLLKLTVGGISFLAEAPPTYAYEPAPQITNWEEPSYDEHRFLQHYYRWQIGQLMAA